MRCAASCGCSELGRAPVEDEDRYYLDDPEDMARFRRKQLEEEGTVIPPPVDEYDPYGDNSDRVFPDAPRDEGTYGNTYPDEPQPDEPDGHQAPAARRGFDRSGPAGGTGRRGSAAAED